MERIVQDGEVEFEYKQSIPGRNSIMERHCHALFEVIAVLQGDINVILEDGSYRCVSDQLVVIPPLAYHSVSANQGAEYRRVKILFRREWIPAAIEADFVSKAAAGPIVGDLQTGAALKTLEQALTCEAADRYLPLLKSLLVQLLYCCADRRTTASPREVDITLQRIIRYIEKHIHEKILLDEIAGDLYVSKSSICHLFAQKMNISIKQYILQKKMAYAAQLMQNGMSALEASRSVGYENYSNFYRVYRKTYQKPPSGDTGIAGQAQGRAK